MIKTITVNNFIKGNVFTRANENSYKEVESQNNKHVYEVDTDDKHLMHMLNQFAPVAKQLR